MQPAGPPCPSLSRPVLSRHAAFRPSPAVTPVSQLTTVCESVRHGLWFTVGTQTTAGPEAPYDPERTEMAPAGGGGRLVM